VVEVIEAAELRAAVAGVVGTYAARSAGRALASSLAR
jgi:hypothetical protein